MCDGSDIFKKSLYAYNNPKPLEATGLSEAKCPRWDTVWQRIILLIVLILGK
jgi:hypothetical protein